MWKRKWLRVNVGHTHTHVYWYGCVTAQQPGKAYFTTVPDWTCGLARRKLKDARRVYVCVTASLYCHRRAIVGSECLCHESCVLRFQSFETWLVTRKYYLARKSGYGWRQEGHSAVENLFQQILSYPSDKWTLEMMMVNISLASIQNFIYIDHRRGLNNIWTSLGATLDHWAQQNEEYS